MEASVFVMFFPTRLLLEFGTHVYWKWSNCPRLGFEQTSALLFAIPEKVDSQVYCLIACSSMQIPQCTLWLTTHLKRSNKVWLSSHLAAMNLTYIARVACSPVPPTPHTHTHFDVSELLELLVCVGAVGCQHMAKLAICHTISVNQLPWKIIPAFQGFPHPGNHHSRLNPWIPLCSPHWIQVAVLQFGF